MRVVGTDCENVTEVSVSIARCRLDSIFVPSTFDGNCIIANPDVAVLDTDMLTRVCKSNQKASNIVINDAFDMLGFGLEEIESSGRDLHHRT